MDCESQEQFKIHSQIQNMDGLIIQRLSQKSKKIFKIALNKQFVKFESYNRKEKSLEELSKKFIDHLITFDEKDVHLDQMTLLLKVERRRLYDIINILESVQVIKRKCKNQYLWMGFRKIMRTVEMYQENVDSMDLACTKREKSLEVMAAGIIRMFLYGSKVWTLEEAASKLAEKNNLEKVKTKIRRLYDIANVFRSIGLIKKIHLSNNKPAFEWVGIPGLNQYYEQQINLKKQQGQLKITNHDRYMDFTMSNRTNNERTVQKQPPNEQPQQQITPKLRRTITIIPPRVSTPKRTPNVKGTNRSKENTPISKLALINKFNETQ
ncbi:hypothetical protein pb186bvf_004461 [Paramecium bursaria]